MPSWLIFILGILTGGVVFAIYGVYWLIKNMRDWK